MSEKYLQCACDCAILIIQKITNGVTIKYVYGLGLIGEEKCGDFKTYHFDYRGSTAAITDSCGNVTDTFEYDTYGNLTGRTGNSFVIFGYNGRDGVVTDKNGLIYMRARYYNPLMHRFINADVVPGEISDAVTLNRYAYANGNPVSNTDPFGLSAEERGVDLDWDIGVTDTVGWLNDSFDIFKRIYDRLKYGFSVYKKGAYAVVKGARSAAATSQGINGTRYAFKNAGNYSNVFKYVSPKIAVKDALTGKGSVLGYALVAVDTLAGIHDNINSGTRVQKTVSDAVVDAGLGIGSIAVSAAAGAKLGAMVGTVCPGIGNIVGAVGGAAAGVALYFITDVVRINGKTGSEWVKEGAGAVADSLVEAGQWVADAASDIWLSTKDFAENAVDAVGNFFSGVFDW